MTDKEVARVSLDATDDPNRDPNGVHPLGDDAGGVPAPEHYHFNVLKLVRDAKQEFETRNPGKVATFFYAPEPLLYLIDRSVKSASFTGGVDASTLARSTVTQVFGMELISIAGTCVTVTQEAIHEDEAVEVSGIPMPPPTSDLN